MRVAFYMSRFQLRGTAIAIYDYAAGLINTKRGTPVILHWPRPDERDSLGDSRGVSIWEQRDSGARELFEQRLGRGVVKEYRSWEELRVLMTDQVDLLYVLTSGIRAGSADGQAPNDFDLDDMLSRLNWPGQLNHVRVVYHFVYLPPMAGYGSAAISAAVASRVRMFPGGKPNDVQVVPHILRDWPDVEPMEVQRLRMREYLGIPPQATVFGRLGGVDTFNIRPVTAAIDRVLAVRKDVYFIFATAPLEVLQETSLNSDPRVLFIKPTNDDVHRCALIDACDYMVHASQKGESFGLSVLEFLSRGRPVVTFEPRLSELERLRGGGVVDAEGWLGYHQACLPDMYWADQHLRHLRVLAANPKLRHLYVPYWDRASLDGLLRDLRPLVEPVTPVRFHEYSEEQVMRAFDGAFLNPPGAGRPLASVGGGDGRVTESVAGVIERE